MTFITRFDPLAELTRLDPFSDDFFRDFALRPVLRSSELVQQQIRMDVAEDDKAYSVKADIPGAKKEDIRVSIDGKQVSINAELKNGKDEPAERKLIRRERPTGSVSRSFSLAHEVDDSQAHASYTDGVLELVLPKKAEGSFKSITVS